MCVRFGQSSTAKGILEKLKAAIDDIPLPRDDIFPGEMGQIVLSDPDGDKRLVVARWGLTPHWAKEADYGKKHAYNARSETIREKPTFREAFKKRRCVIPASAIYERAEGRWLRLVPIQVEAFPIAGLWEPANDVSGSITFTMATTEPNETMAKVHDRMPVILDESDMALWMAADAPTEGLRSLLLPCPPEWLAIEDAGPITRKSPSLFA
ncbi:SOS response-associated peptidase [soil metagenome]